jgi:hypothetical protein
MRRAGRRGGRRKEKKPKARPWSPRRRARVRGRVHDFSCVRARACRWLGHSGEPECQRTARRPKETRNGTSIYARGERRRRHLQESVPAWHEGRHHTAQARRRQGDPALGSMVGPHRGKEGPFLTSVAIGRREVVCEETVGAAKRKAAALVGEAERRHGEEEGDARRRASPVSSSPNGSGFTTTAHSHSGPRLLSPTPPLHRRQRPRDWGGIPERLGFGGWRPRWLLYRWW